jgi:hypothetical protein
MMSGLVLGLALSAVQLAPWPTRRRTCASADTADLALLVAASRRALETVAPHLFGDYYTAVAGQHPGAAPQQWS